MLYRFKLIVLGLICASCANLEYYKEKPTPKTSTEAATTTLASIRKTYKAKSALQNINQFLLENPKNELTLPAYLLKAQILLRQRKNKEACKA